MKRNRDGKSPRYLAWAVASLLLWAVGATPCRPLLGADLEGLAPSFSLPGLDAKEHALAELKGHPAVVIFGELYNHNSLDALTELAKLLQEPALSESGARSLLIVGSQDSTEKLANDWQELKQKSKDDVLVLHDRRREQFERYGVKVLPTIVIVDAQGQIAMTVSGYPLNFSDVVSEALLYATGKIEKGRLDRALHPENSTGSNEVQLKALRTAKMGSALAKRKLFDLAVARFEEARSLDPTLLDARLGLASVQLELGKVEEAYALFGDVLAMAPANVTAHIGLARIEIRRDQLDHAEKRLKEQVALHPLHAELHFLLGEAYEKRGRKEEALSAYKRASMLLLQRAGER